MFPPGAFDSLKKCTTRKGHTQLPRLFNTHLHNVSIIKYDRKYYDILSKYHLDLKTLTQSIINGFSKFKNSLKAWFVLFHLIYSKRIYNNPERCYD